MSGIAAAALLFGAFGSAEPAAAQGAGRLSKHDRELIAVARANGKGTVTLLVAAKRGRNNAAASEVAGLGGVVRFREDSIDYLRVDIAIDQADAVAALPSVEAVDVDEVIPLYDPRPEGVNDPIAQPAPGANTPKDNPYMPISEIGASQFMAANPTFDGRGVVVGIIDSGLDLGHPAFQTTTTGERKIVDWVTGTAPTGENDPTWLNMATLVQGPSFTQGGVSYTAPAAGEFRFAVFNERDARLGGEVGSDVNRDGNPQGSSGLFGVLWNTTTNDVYVDTNQNRSFADETAMTDYKVRYDVGTFGTDNPATQVREAMPFVVQTDGQNKFVNIGIVSGAHGSHVAGIVGANGMFGGQMSGAAPGVQFVSVRACLFVEGCTAVALTEGMTYAAKQANVDVINMSIGGLPSLNDGNNARAFLYDRLIETYNVQMFISAGNSGPGMNTIGDPSVASKVISVGSYISNATYTANYGTPMPFADNLHYFSSRGPREDGGFKPQIVAPGSAISTVPTWQPQGCLVQTCAVGYAMFNGTSMASPQAAGGAALLVSAAKQTGAQSQPAQLRQAINSSARYLTGRYQAYEQGNGLMNVGAAWNLLKQNIKTSDIRSSVSVNTALSGFLGTPGFGQGIYDREGVIAGKTYTREYTFVRTKGTGRTVTYNLAWVDNNGTFSSVASIALPLNKAVKLPVTVSPKANGANSAILNLDDPATPGVDFQTMNVVVVADQFNAANNYTVTKTGTVGAGQFQSFFFNVPAGTPAFKVDLEGGSADKGAGAIRFLRWHPYGVGIDSNAASNCYTSGSGTCTTGSTTSRTTSNPQAGVWEVTVDARRASDNLSGASFTLTASILGASVSPNPIVVSAATVGTPVSFNATLTNLFGTFTGRGASSGNLGSAFRATESIANLGVKEFTVEVPAGSTSFRATIGSPSDNGADLDLYVLRNGVVVGQSADGDSEESVTISNPSAGTYTVQIDGYAVPAGTTTYKYVDVFVNPTLGTVSVTDADATRAAGTSWTVPGVVTAKAVPAAGRILLGTVEVRTSSNVLVGQGEVVVQSVTP